MSTHYHTNIKFTFLLKDLCAEDEGGFPEQYRGKFNVLQMISHKSSPVIDNPQYGAATDLEHKLPEYCNFKFFRVREWG